MKTSQFLLLIGAIYIAPLQPSVFNAGISVAFSIAAIVAMVLDK